MWNQQLFTSDLTILLLRCILKYKEFKNKSPLKEKILVWFKWFRLKYKNIKNPMAKMCEKTFSVWKQQHLLVDATLLHTHHKFECRDLEIQFPD